MPESTSALLVFQACNDKRRHFPEWRGQDICQNQVEFFSGHLLHAARFDPEARNLVQQNIFFRIFNSQRINIQANAFQTALAQAMPSTPVPQPRSRKDCPGRALPLASRSPRAWQAKAR